MSDCFYECTMTQGVKPKGIKAFQEYYIITENKGPPLIPMKRT